MYGDLVVPEGQGSLLIWIGNNTIFDHITQFMKVNIKASGKLAFFVYENKNQSFIHCCTNNMQFDKESLGAYNSITIIRKDSNVTFWHDWFWGKYYSTEESATLGLRDVTFSLITIMQSYVNITAEYNVSSSFLLCDVRNSSVVRVVRLQMNSTEEHIKFNKRNKDGKNFIFGGIAKELDKSDLILIDSTFNVKVNIYDKTESTGLIVGVAVNGTGINITNCDVNYSIIFADAYQADSPGVIGRDIGPNMTLILNVTTRMYVKKTITPGSGFIATAVLGNFTIVNTTADITLNGGSFGTGFLGFVEQNAT